jgi:hypothetical protein
MSPEKRKSETTSEPGPPNLIPLGSITKDTGDIDAGVSHHAELDNDQYPHGLKLVVLAAAALVAVFLIALDQVSKLVTPRP